MADLNRDQQTDERLSCWRYDTVMYTYSSMTLRQRSGWGGFSGSSSQMLEEWGISNNYQYVNENRTVTVILKWLSGTSVARALAYINSQYMLRNSQNGGYGLSACRTWRLQTYGKCYRPIAHDTLGSSVTRGMIAWLPTHPAMEYWEWKELK